MIKCNDEILNKFVESIGTKYNFNNKQKEVLQNEVSVTITQLLNSNKLTNKPVETNIDNDSGVYIINSPINDLYDLSQSLINSPDNLLKLFIKHPSFVDVKSNHQDIDGDEFQDTIGIPANEYIYIGSISRTNKIWSFKIDHNLDNSYFDINMYIRCWNCIKNSHIRDFINDIYYRINKLNQYSVNNQSLNKSTNNIIITNESVNLDTEDDVVQYSMEFNPNNVIVYLNDNFNDMLNENDSDEDNIKAFLEAVFDQNNCNVKNCEIIKINESLSKAIVTVVGTLALGKATNSLLKSIGIGNITRNPNSDIYQSNINQVDPSRRVKSYAVK